VAVSFIGGGNQRKKEKEKEDKIKRIFKINIG
jgi:hypothetical protein